MLAEFATRLGLGSCVLGFVGFGFGVSEVGSYLRLIDFCITQL